MYECMAHVCKRMKAHLIEGKKEVIRKAKTEKERQTILRLDKGDSEKQVKKQLAKEFSGKLRTTVVERGEWRETTEKNEKNSAREIHHLSDNLCLG